MSLLPVSKTRLRDWGGVPMATSIKYDAAFNGASEEEKNWRLCRAGVEDKCLVKGKATKEADASRTCGWDGRAETVYSRRLRSNIVCRIVTRKVEEKFDMKEFLFLLKPTVGTTHTL